MVDTRERNVLSSDMASLRGLGGFEVTSTEIVLDRAGKHSDESRIFFDIDKWIIAVCLTLKKQYARVCVYVYQNI